MNYVEYLNQHFKSAVAGREKLVIYGQNVSTGSCLSGLARGFDKLPNCIVINTSNAEATLVGMGFGLMLRGVSSIFFMKQLDFLLLGVEQLTNTWNALRHRTLNASFTIVPIVVDSGWEGPQSCLNDLANLSALTRVPGYTIVTSAEADEFIDGHVFAPGVRIVAVSQRLFRTPVLDAGAPRFFGRDRGVAQYAKGSAATIAAYNFALPEAKALHDELAGRGQSASLFSVCATMPDDVDAVLADAERTGCLVVVDDSRGFCAQSRALVAAMRGCGGQVQIVDVSRPWTVDAAVPNADQFDFIAPAVADRLGLRV